jgi:uncharacterized protein
MRLVTPQEQQLLKQLTDRINQTKLEEKDPDAENLLGRELGANPDALYIMAQTVLVQNIALEQARAQVDQLQQQAQQARQQPAHATSFLGRLLGDRDPQPPPPPQPGYQPVPQYSQSQYAPPPPPPYSQPQYAQPQYGQPQYVPVQGGQPSFLRGAMQTAAGVAAGALAFEGVESVLHGLGGFGHPGMGMGGYGMGGFGGGGGFERPVEETVVNNYYDEPGGEHRGFGSGDEPHLHEAGELGSSGDDRTLADDGMGFTDDTSDNSGDDGGGVGFDDGGGSFDSDSSNDLI